jgi:molecular chaperone Hsp33
MDRLEQAFAPKAGMRVAFVETTMAAKALEARHLCGPVAAAALAEVVTAAALLGMDAASDDEAVMLRINTAGPLGGALVEALGDGSLRGFTHRKTLPELDGLLPVDTAAAWGSTGAVQIMITRPGKILSQAVFNCSPPAMRFVLGRYFNRSVQVPTASTVWVEAGQGGLISARGLLAQRMPDGDAATFVRVLEAFEDGSVQARLSAAPPHRGARAFGDLSGFEDIDVRQIRPLQWRCRCSRERSLAMLETLTRDELEDQLRRADGQDIICHMCGQTYHFGAADLQAAMARKT